MTIIKTLALVLPLLFSAAGLAAGPEVGVKLLNPPAAPLGPVVEQMRAAGVTAVFCRTDYQLTDASAAQNTREFRRLLHEAGIKFFITAPIFCDPDAVKADPGLLGIGHLGNPSKSKDAGWLQFVCPTRPDFRKTKIANIVAEVRDLHPDGISLDFIRYFIYWEKVPPAQPADSIEKFCFCDNCLRLMSAELGFKFPASAQSREAKAAWVLAGQREKWTEWKCEKITSMVRDTAAAAKAVSPGLLISLHGVPWQEQEYDGGRRVIAGQDLHKLAPYVDLFGPMCYFQMLQRSPEWIHEVAAEYTRLTGKRPLPSAQASGSPDLFRRHVLAAFQPPSLGINIFSWPSLKNDPEKLEIVRQALPSK